MDESITQHNISKFDGDSIANDNMQSLIEVLNRYPGTILKKNPNGSKILVIPVQQRNASVDYSHQNDFVEDIEHYLDNMSIIYVRKENEQRGNFLPEQSILLQLDNDYAEHELQNFSILEPDNQNNNCWESQLECWLDNLTFKKQMPHNNENDDDLDDLEQILK